MDVKATYRIKLKDQEIILDQGEATELYFELKRVLGIQETAPVVPPVPYPAPARWWWEVPIISKDASTFSV